MNLTPEFICHQPNYPTIRISLLEKNLLTINGISKDRLITGYSYISLIETNYLVIDNIPSPVYNKEPNQEQITSCIVFAEKAFLSAKLKDWEAFAINLDKGYNREREILENNIKCDLAYTTARTLGALGGYPSKNKLFLVCPQDLNDKIKEGVLDAIRTLS